MSEYEIIEHKSFKPEIIAFEMVIFALLGPTGVAIQEFREGEFTIFILGLTYLITIGSSVPSNGGGSSPMPNAFSLLHPASIFRLLFVYFLYLYYQERTSELTVLVTGLIAELILVLMNLSSIFSRTQFYVPLPILLPIGLILVLAIPPDKILGPWGENDEPYDWFSETP